MFLDNIRTKAYTRGIYESKYMIWNLENVAIREITKDVKTNALDN
jgi:hypothetical protein